MKNMPLLMGILNATPDSFYDGGSYITVDSALKRAHTILKEGGQIIDVGGESTRPDSRKVSVDEEIRRAVPVIKEIKKRFPFARISIDTYNFETARAALDEGANIINDISGFADTRLPELAKKYNAKLVIMHMRGTPATMQTMCDYGDILKEIYAFFEEKISIAISEGLEENDIILDIGLGFAKTREQNWFLLENLNYFDSLKLPQLVGASRKSFTDKTLEKSLKAAEIAARANAAILRVHDVGKTKRFLENC